MVRSTVQQFPKLLSRLLGKIENHSYQNVVKPLLGPTFWLASKSKSKIWSFLYYLNSSTTVLPANYRERPGGEIQISILQTSRDWWLERQEGAAIESYCITQENWFDNMLDALKWSILGSGMKHAVLDVEVKKGRLLRKVRAGAMAQPFQGASWGYPRLEQNSALPSLQRKPARSPCDLNNEISRGGGAKEVWAESDWATIDRTRAMIGRVRALLAKTESGLAKQGLAGTSEAYAAVLYEALCGRMHTEVTSSLHMLPRHNQ